MLLVGQASGQVPVDALPSFTDSDPAKYQGEAPNFSQNIQYDHDGNLLFFVIDGRVFDHEGYLIADNSSTANCMECLFKGIGQFATTLVPGSCTQYYLVAAEFIPSNNHALGYAILDLEQPNPHWPQRHGRVLSFDDITNDPGLDDQFGDAVINAPSWQDNDNSLFQSVSECMINLDEEPEMTWGFENGLQLAIYDTDDLVNQKKLLLAVDEASLYYYEVTNTGINKINSFTQGEPLNSSTSAFGNGTRRPWGGTCAFGKANGTDLLFAMSATETDLTGGPVPSVFLFRIGFNGTVEWLQDITTSTQGPGVLEVTGLVFSPDAQTLYVLQNKAPYLASIDLATFAITDLAGPLTINQPNAFGLGTLALDKAPSGSGLALYALSDTRAACKESPDQPLAPNSWVDPLPVAGTLTQRPTFSYSNGSNITLLPDMHNFNEQQVNTISGSTCCTYRAALAAVHGATLTGSPNLTPSSNPWGTSAEVIFDQDVIVPAGAILNVTGMTWRFSEDARLTIQRGGMATFNGCVLTSYACEGLRWPGVRIEGTSGVDQFPSIGGDQGQARFNNSTVERAVVGAWCAREVGGAGVTGYYGGILRTTGSTFRNCIAGARVENYTVTSNQLSYFTNTTFVNDTDWPDALAPQPCAYIYNTRGVNFTNCRFANDAGWNIESGGIGIASLNALVRVNGDANPANTYFRNLLVGLLNFNGITNSTFADEMHFQNNVYGIYDIGSRFARYTRNTFSVPDQNTGLLSRTGIYLSQSQLYTIERNVVLGEDPLFQSGENSTGFYFLGYAPGQNVNSWVYNENRIYDNDFADLTWGNLVRYIHRGDGIGEEEWGLQPLCGDYTNNRFDIAMLEQTIIRPHQGEPNAADQQSGNRFLDPADCSTTFDWWLDADWNNIPGWAPGMSTTVFGNADPTCDVLCDGWNDFADIAVGGSFDPNVECNGGVLDNPGGHTQFRQAYDDAMGMLDAALNAYNGGLDGGERPDLLEMLKQEPPLGSSVLRDAMLANSPLSDEVMLAMLSREPAMDPWHITQVLVANVRLNDGIIALAGEVLTPFYCGIVSDAQNGSGITWKQVMEKEIVLRRRQKTEAFTALGFLYLSDTTIAGGPDSLKLLLGSDLDPEYTQFRTELYISTGQWAAAWDELNGPGKDLNGAAVYADLLTMAQAHNGAWSAMDATEQALLTEHMLAGHAGASFAAGVLWGIGATDHLEPVTLPRDYRSMTQAEDGAMPGEPGEPAARPAIAVYPNPAANEVYVTLPPSTKGDLLEVIDVHGRLVLAHRIKELGLCRLDIAVLPAGFYKAVVPSTGLSTSFTILR